MTAKVELRITTPFGVFTRRTACPYTHVAVWGPVERVFASWHRSEALARAYSTRPLLGIFAVGGEA